MKSDIDRFKNNFKKYDTKLNYNGGKLELEIKIFHQNYNNRNIEVTAKEFLKPFLRLLSYKEKKEVVVDSINQLKYSTNYITGINSIKGILGQIEEDIRTSYILDLQDIIMKEENIVLNTDNIFLEKLVLKVIDKLELKRS